MLELSLFSIVSIRVFLDSQIIDITLLRKALNFRQCDGIFVRFACL